MDLSYNQLQEKLPHRIILLTHPFPLWVHKLWLELGLVLFLGIMKIRGCSEQSIRYTTSPDRGVNLSTYMREQDTERILCKNVFIDIVIYIGIGVSGLTVSSTRTSKQANKEKEWGSSDDDALFLFYSPTPLFLLLFSFHLVTTHVTLQIVTLILLGENLLTTLPHIIPFSYRPSKVGSVLSRIRDSSWTMGFTPSHMVTRTTARRCRVYGSVRSCFFGADEGKSKGPHR